ncbi:hypothetical protein [Catellatospora paridis]|uniref:hypothetical protein n=1 Tax=Catellatospora paridis TaxID=1617086 RepID=UPI0012D43CF8|nr:hypothetical protein [Catellatospora paridis]
MTTLVAPYALPDQAADRGPRPATATVAVWLQGAAVLLCGLLIGLAWLAHLHMTELIDEAARLAPGTAPAVVAAERDADLVATIVMTVVLGLMTAWFGATLVPLWRGANVGRIMSLVGAGLIAFGGVALSCLGLFSLLLLAPLFLLPMDPADPMTDGTDPFADLGSGDPFIDKLYELSGEQPHWTDVAPGLLLPLLAALLLATFVLLLVPPSNRWYSRRPAPPRGMYPGHPYPGHPYPGYPVHLHPGQQYLYPGQPYQPVEPYPPHPGAVQAAPPEATPPAATPAADPGQPAAGS